MVCFSLSLVFCQPIAPVEAGEGVGRLEVGVGGGKGAGVAAGRGAGFEPDGEFAVADSLDPAVAVIGVGAFS